MKHQLIALVAGVFATLSLTAVAGPGIKDFPRHLETEKDAMDCCKGGGTVALVCKDCKTVQTTKQAKGVASWFKPNATHGCSGCGSKITVQQAPGGKGAAYPKVEHVCSKCGPKSPYICTDHKA